jgi:hypothetical protein
MNASSRRLINGLAPIPAHGVNAPHWTAPALASARKLKKPSLHLGRQGLFSTFQDGGAKEARTPDLLNAIQTLYQLSYDPIHETGC